jgi:hypothetical protein
MVVSSYGTLKFWLDATQETYADGAGVSSWTDRQGPGGNNFTGDGAALPLMHRTAMNGLPGIYFDGTNNRRFYRIEPGIFPAAYTVLMVAKFGAAIPSGATNRFIWDSDNDNNISRHYCAWMADGSIRIGTDGGGGFFDLPAGRIVPGTPTVLSATYNGASSELRLGLVNVVTGTLTTTTAAGAVSFFGSVRTSTPSVGLMHMSEIVGYTAPLSTANLVKVTQELMAKYRIPLPGVVIG